MKKSTLFILPFILFATTGCSNNDAIYMVHNYDEQNLTGIDVKATDLVTMLDGKMSFVLYTYSESCVHCTTVSEHFATYIEEYNLLMYRFYPMDVNYQDLVDKWPSIFPEYRTTPKVQIIKDGELMVEINVSRLYEYKLFSQSMSQFVRESSYYTLSKYDSFQRFDSSFDDFLIFFYRSDNQDSVFNFSQNIYNALSSCRLPSLFIDIESAEQELLNQLREIYSLQEQLEQIAFHIKNGTKKEEVTYTYENPSSLQTFISQFID